MIKKKAKMSAGWSKMEKCRQHSDFPGGHPPEYYPSLKLLDFADRTGYGIFSLRWPSTLDYTLTNNTSNTNTLDSTYSAARTTINTGLHSHRLLPIQSITRELVQNTLPLFINQMFR